MSRSRRAPRHTQQQHSKTSTLDKRIANRVTRHFKLEISPGKEYRKHSNSWDIRDWSFYSPKDPKAKRK